MITKWLKRIVSLLLVLILDESDTLHLVSQLQQSSRMN